GRRRAGTAGRGTAHDARVLPRPQERRADRGNAAGRADVRAGQGEAARAAAGHDRGGARQAQVQRRGAPGARPGPGRAVGGVGVPVPPEPWRRSAAVGRDRGARPSRPPSRGSVRALERGAPVSQGIPGVQTRSARTLDANSCPNYYPTTTSTLLENPPNITPF